MSNSSYPINTDMTDYRVEVLDEDWNEQLLKLSKESPVQTKSLGIHFDRAPDVFTIPKLTSFKYRCLGFFHKSTLAGYAMACYQRRYIHGKIAEVLYLGNMHVSEKGLGKLFLRELTLRFERIVPQSSEVKYLYAYVIDKNIPAMKLVQLGNLQSRVIGKIVMSTIFLITPKRLSRKYKIRRAKPEDLEAIVTLLVKEQKERFLAPEMDHAIFKNNLEQRPNFGLENHFVALDGGSIVGVCSAWDMTPFKKNRIIAYGKKLNLIRYAYNLAAVAFGGTTLPGKGAAFQDITIAEYAVKDRNPEIMEALLRSIYRSYRSKGYHALIFGSSMDDPLLKATESFVSNKVVSNVVLGSLEEHLEGIFDEEPLIYADAVQI